MKRERSAGGIVVKGDDAVVVVPRTGRYALPKGHPDGDETFEEAAKREVREEAGVDADLVTELGETTYFYRWQGERIHKTVKFFLFEYRSGDVSQHDDEVLTAEWVPLRELPERLSYKGEQQIARRAIEVLEGN